MLFVEFTVFSLEPSFVTRIELFGWCEGAVAKFAWLAPANIIMSPMFTILWFPVTIVLFVYAACCSIIPLCILCGIYSGGFCIISKSFVLVPPCKAFVKFYGGTGGLWPTFFEVFPFASESKSCPECWLARVVSWKWWEYCPVDGSCEFAGRPVVSWLPPT